MASRESYDSKLYLFDATLCEASATVRQFIALDSLSKHGTHKLILNQTIFHPQGGGQPSDSGKIYSLDRSVIFEVNSVHYNSDDGNIHHIGNILQGTTDSLQEGTEVILSVNSHLRLLHKKLHSAGHVIDAAMKRIGYSTKLSPGKGYHFPDGPYVEYSGELTEEELTSLPNLLNEHIQQMISEQIPSQFHILSKEEASVLCECDTSASSYPDLVRVVEIARSACPCGGTHIDNTMELDGLQITRIKKKKKILKISYEMTTPATAEATAEPGEVRLS
jgi:Ser-tRNA(Ala) deacylase AlaX